jgi:hypothetical protein
MELKPPKFDQEIKKITTLQTRQNTFWLELKYGYGVGKFLEHGIK